MRSQAVLEQAGEQLPKDREGRALHLEVQRLQLRHPLVIDIAMDLGEFCEQEPSPCHIGDGFARHLARENLLVIFRPTLPRDGIPVMVD
jgi:hypothetical protein